MAITYLAGNNIAGLANDRASLTTTYLLTGTTFLETDTDDMYQWDGDSWNVIAGDAIAQTLENKKWFGFQKVWSSQVLVSVLLAFWDFV